MVELDFDKGGGLIPAIAQDYASGDVLMLGYINAESWRRTLECGEAVYFSRSRGKLWHKGETSGNVQRIREIRIDCDRDTVLFLVEQVGGAACHTGHASCFFTRLNEDGSTTLIGEPLFDPDKVYHKQER